MLKIFLSSTFKDLINERKAVQSVVHRLSAHYIGMEYFGSFSELPKLRCLKLVQQSDLFILILGTSYGYTPDGISSMTETEYCEAKSHGIPILAYFAGYITHEGEGKESIKRIRFHDEIKKEYGVTWFHSPEDLAWKVACDIAREFPKNQRPHKTTFDDVKDKILIDPIKNDINDLIATLENRANKMFIVYATIILQTNKSPAAMQLMRFRELHEQHIDALKQGHISEAHDILLEIHKISYEIETIINPPRDTSSQLPLLLYIRMDFRVFQRKPLCGGLIRGYLGRDAEIGYEGYAINQSNTTANSTNGIFRFRTELEKPSPTRTVKLYEEILYGPSLSDSESRSTEDEATEPT